MIHDISLYNHNICEGSSDSLLDFHSERMDKNSILYKGSKVFLQYSHYEKDHRSLKLFLIQKYSADEKHNIFIVTHKNELFSCEFHIDLSKDNSIEITQEAIFQFNEDKDLSELALAFGKNCEVAAVEFVKDCLNIVS